MRFQTRQGEVTARGSNLRWILVSLFVCSFIWTSSPAVAGADGWEPPSDRTILQPEPLKLGPGSLRYGHQDWRVSQGGEGINSWFAFEPTHPRPALAPLAVITHGYGEFSGYDRLYELIRHTVRKGNVVVFPRWQVSDFDPCPGPFHIKPCMDSAARGIHGALEYLRDDPSRVQPDTNRTSYYGYSFGGIITANLANQYQQYGLPRPRAIMLDDPHDGEVAGLGEPALDDSLEGIPAEVKFNCHSGADGVLGVPRLIDGSCNAVFPKLGHIPNRNKALTSVQTDSWGSPELSSRHGVCASNPGTADAYDWRFCWRDWDALRSCAFTGRLCHLSLGTGRKHRWLGRWSDGTPVARLTVRKQTPLIP